MTFIKPLQVEGQEAQISEEICNKHGIKRLKFSDPHGPYFYYEQPTNKSFGDQPNLRDPLDKKYMYLKNSNIFPGAGEGAFATRDVPADTIFSPYGGMLYTWKQREILDEKHNKTRLENGWNDDDEKSVALYKYRYVNMCNEKLPLILIPNSNAGKKFVKILIYFLIDNLKMIL